MKFTDEQGWLEVPDDIEDIELLFPLIGSAEGVDRDHGTTEEREAVKDCLSRAGLLAPAPA